MVQTGQAFAADIHLSQAILGLVVLAVATSLPNTVVAFTLARSVGASACVEEVLSSNSINATLGMAFPLLLWQPIHSDPARTVVPVCAPHGGAHAHHADWCAQAMCKSFDRVPTGPGLCQLGRGACLRITPWSRRRTRIFTPT